MALSTERAGEHVRFWSSRLRRSPLCANWPSHLFHTADLTNVVPILTRGRLVCRRGLDEIPCDAANQDALWNNPEAHSFVRLYFRPRTMFHLSTEGIKCLGDPYRRDPHMSIPVMLAFDAPSILTLEGVGFSRGKLSRKLPIGFDNDFFQSIDFERVYHDGPTRDQAIQDHRMAEVVVPDELPLRPFLRKVICRTALERRTLLHRLGRQAVDLSPLIVVEQIQQSCFLHKSLYLTHVGFQEGKLRLDLHAPKDPPRSGQYQAEITHRVGGEIVQEWRGGFPATTAALLPLRDRPHGIWTIRLEETLAYEAPIPAETSVIR
jgi:hypothetical protein